MRWIKRALLAVLVLAVAGGGWLAYQLNDRPDLAPYAHLYLAPAPAAAPGELRVRFLGVSTLLFDDGETAILTDGFFSRPPLWRLLLGRVQPDPDRIAAQLARAGVDRLAAVIGVHSHYDHVLDAPEVARRTGALLLGSVSTANVGRGGGLPEDRIRIVRPGEPLRFGRFRVTLLESRHAAVASADGETIDAPLTPPARASDYREGGSYSVLVEHGGRRMLVQGSAGYLEGALRDRRVDVAFLGVGALGKQGDGYRQAYWRETVQLTGARRVFAIHWDDFTRPLEQPLVPLPRLVDDLDATLRFLLARGEVEQVDVRLAPVGEPMDPFAGL